MKKTLELLRYNTLINIIKKDNKIDKLEYDGKFYIGSKYFLFDITNNLEKYSDFMRYATKISISTLDVCKHKEAFTMKLSGYAYTNYNSYSAPTIVELTAVDNHETKNKWIQAEMYKLFPHNLYNYSTFKAYFKPIFCTLNTTGELHGIIMPYEHKRI